MVARLRNLLRAIAIAGETRFGSTLDAAVREYQKSRGLVVDGIVGANTRAELDKDAANLI
jgi:peptidoglycan hydrolase-like protein with peptidoglycan-binding domain